MVRLTRPKVPRCWVPRANYLQISHTPDGTVGPLERGLKNATKSGQNFVGWVGGFYSEWSDELTKLPETLADAQVVRWQSKYYSMEENPRSNSERGY